MPFSSSAHVLIHASKEQIWRAITDPALVKQYFFGTNLVTDWKVGSPLFFRGEHDGKTYEDRGTVRSFEPRESLSFDYWSSFSGLPDQPELRQLVRYDLEDAPGAVRVVIRQSNVDTQERADHSAKNWQAVLEGLRKLVEGSART
jgi:uncharacterized protein YndB with AHSA1/START domain